MYNGRNNKKQRLTHLWLAPKYQWTTQQYQIGHELPKIDFAASESVRDERQHPIGGYPVMGTEAG